MKIETETEGRATAPNRPAEFLSALVRTRALNSGAIRARVVLSSAGAPLVVIRHGRSRTVMQVDCLTPLIDELIEVHRVLCLHGLERNNGDC